MAALSHVNFIRTLPEQVVPRLPKALQSIQVRQPFRWIIQFHYGEPRLHYEVTKARQQGSFQGGWELGFHCESKDKQLNRFLLDGFRRHLFEIKDILGDSVEAEMWDKGWTKIYEVYPENSLTDTYQAQLGKRLAEIITCLHPVYVNLRNAVAQTYR